MKLSLFLLISIALHAAGLVYPVVFLRAQREEPVPVVLVAAEDANANELGASGTGAGNGDEPIPGHHPALQTIARNSGEEKTQPKEPPSPVAVTPTQNDLPAGIEVAAVAAATETRGSFAGQFDGGSGGEGGGGGKGNSGSGVGSGGGVGDGAGGSRFVQASYSYSPKPEYPVAARKEGKEGRVVLRVLVDEEGKSKSVEVNDSSGSETLDRAAAEAIKRWRFSPAHYGNKSVESWVKVPIDFRLSDVKN